MKIMRYLAVALLCIGCGPKEPDLLIPKIQPVSPIKAKMAEAETKVEDEGIEPIELPARPVPYTIRTGDVLKISVLGEPEMTTTLPVGPDGRLSYYVAHSVVAAGRTFEELRADLSERLRIHFRDPQVSVSGQEYKGNTASVVGYVGKSGQYVVRSDTRLLDLIAMAGGIAGTKYNYGDYGGLELANLRDSYLLRGKDFVNVDFEKLFSKDHKAVARNNVHILAGDRIYVPSSSSLDNKIFILGEVKTPKVFRFQRDVSLLEAVAECGGVKASAWERRAFVVRGSLKAPTVIPINLRNVAVGRTPDVPLKSGDIVFVPKTALGKIEEVARQVAPLLQDARELKTLTNF